jgi:hypothetical protein
MDLSGIHFANVFNEVVALLLLAAVIGFAATR